VTWRIPPQEIVILNTFYQDSVKIARGKATDYSQKINNFFYSALLKCYLSIGLKRGSLSAFGRIGCKAIGSAQKIIGRSAV
jgi:hypothetical protein